MVIDGLGQPNRVVCDAHSMGGLLVRAAAAVSGALDDVAEVIMLGTPFDGAAKAVLVLGSGFGGPPLPARRLREIAITMPGLYDLLPAYRCVDEGEHVRRLTAADVAGIDGSRELTQTAFDHHHAAVSTPIVRHQPVIGVEQPTVSSVRLDAGQVAALFHTFAVGADGELLRDDDSGMLMRLRAVGDGTVPRNSAVPNSNPDVFPLAQQHGPIARADEAITFCTGHTSAPQP